MAIVSRRTAPHYDWGDGCEGWRLLEHPRLSVIEELMPPNTFEVHHAHDQARQVFYVLDGELTVQLGDEVSVLTAGDAVHAPPRVPHQVRNESPKPVRFLVISSPTHCSDRVAVLQTPDDRERSAP